MSCQSQIFSKFVGPEYLTVSSSGPAGEVQSHRMGVYSLTGETHNNMPVWSRHEGPAKLFYTNGKFIFMMMMIITLLLLVTIHDITGGKWMIGDTATELGGVLSVDPAGDLWPHQVTSWKIYSGGWQSDPQLTVTGIINIDILFLYIDIISTLEGRPEHPENITVEDETGDRAHLAGVYIRQGDSRVWKYGDYELSFNG